MAPRSELPKSEKNEVRAANQASQASSGPGIASSSISSSGRSQGSAAISGGSGAILTGQSQDVKREAIGGGSVTVTKIDGMARDLAQNTIYAKITELKGSNFYIEENGLIKEIVVETTKEGVIVLDANGKPVYKIVEIGKANDKKLSLKNALKKGERAISSQADLRKKQEEEIERQRQRAEYEKLKGLTRKVIAPK